MFYRGGGGARGKWGGERRSDDVSDGAASGEEGVMVQRRGKVRICFSVARGKRAACFSGVAGGVKGGAKSNGKQGAFLLPVFRGKKIVASG